MACARALVATAVGGTPEAVVDGTTGLLVPSESPEALADALATLLADPKRAAMMGTEGRKRVLERFTWTANARAMNDIYQQVTRG